MLTRHRLFVAAALAAAFAAGHMRGAGALVDPFAGVSVGLSDPPSRWVAITPSDSTDLTIATRCIWVGGAGDVKVIDQAGNTAVTLVGVQAGTQISGRFSRVYSTGTTATYMVAGY